MIRILLGNRITVDSDEYEKIKQNVEFLMNDRRKELVYKYNNTSLLKYNLVDKEQNIYGYVRDNPGCNKQSVVDYFKTIPGLSRNPVFRIIQSLIERQYFIEERDRHNKNNFKLFINEKNIILSVSNEMDDFRNSFLKLLTQLSLVLSTLKNDKVKKEIFDNIDHFYTKFITIYVFRALPAFTDIIHDEQTLHELYKIIINNIVSIQIKYYEFRNPIQKLLNIPYYEEMCTDDEYDLEIELFSNNGMKREIVPLIECLDSINFRYGRITRVS